MDSNGFTRLDGNVPDRPPTFMLVRSRLSDNAAVVTDRTHRRSDQPVPTSQRFTADHGVSRRYTLDAHYESPQKGSQGCLLDLDGSRRARRKVAWYDPKELFQNYRVKDPTSTDIRLEMANSTLHDNALYAVRKFGGPGWFHSETIDTGFEMLERITKCRDYGLALVNTTHAGVELFRNGHVIRTKVEHSNLEVNWPDVRFDDDLMTKLIEAKFVLVPISDGYKDYLSGDFPWCEDLADVSKIRKEGVTEAGVHWSALLVDCRSNIMVGHYLDSWSNLPDERNISQIIAKDIIMGLGSIMAENGRRFDDARMLVESHTPLQDTHNHERAYDSSSACGPFVWLMAKEYARYIVECHEDGLGPATIDLHLPKDFPRRLDWSSWHTRTTFAGIVARELRTRTWLNGVDRWTDGDDYGSGFQGWLTRKGLPANWFWDPHEMPTQLALPCGPPRSNTKGN